MTAQFDAALPSQSASNPAYPKVVILARRHLPPDEDLRKFLEEELTRRGHQVHQEKQSISGFAWAKSVHQAIQSADAVLILLSPASIETEMLVCQVEAAHDAAAQRRGRPRMIPIRVQLEEPLPQELGAMLESIPPLNWSGPEDNRALLDAILQQLAEAVPTPSMPRITPGLRVMPRPAPIPRARIVPATPGPTRPSWQVKLEPVGGAVPLNSEFYVTRPADAECRAAMGRRDSIILFKGARQIGKTSILARGIQFARERGAKVVLTDFQKLNATHFGDIGLFYLALAESLADQLDLGVLPSDVWDERRGPNINLERYMRREVLAKLKAPLVWGMDEVDRLFTTSFGSEVFGLFRSWHNERALDPSGPWAGLTLAIAYATEAHLFITDVNQSPFNVGTRIALDDFTRDQTADLNRRHGNPLQTQEELNEFSGLVGGHPFLVRRGLHELASRRLSLAAFLEEATRDDGCFGDHLRRLLMMLSRDNDLVELIRGMLRGQACLHSDGFYRLRSAGVIAGQNPADAAMRCHLYAHYLARHLLAEDTTALL